MQGELFKKKKNGGKSKGRLESSLIKYDKKTLAERKERMEYLNKIFPKHLAFAADPATVYIFDECKMTFINGEFISTVLLSQAFIERWLQMHYTTLGHATTASKGLKAIINHAARNDTIHHFLLPKIDELRKVRNPFVHLKEVEHDYNLTQRILKKIEAGGAATEYFVLLESDARSAITLMYAILQTPLR